MKVVTVKEFRFEAAHWLPSYDGPCQNLHGHSYKVQVGVTSVINEETGMVLDFKELKSLVNKFLDQLDHTCLNDVQLEGFPTSNPTAEKMTVWLFQQLSQQLSQQEQTNLIQIEFVRLWETETSYVEVKRSNEG